MKRYVPLITGLIGAIGFVGVAQSADVHKVTGKVTAANRAGSVSKPAPFAANFTYTLDDPSGDRVIPPATWKWKWSGVIADGKDFPTCTADQIDAAQSDSVCPKGSLIAEGPFVAVLGPTNDRTQKIFCKGKVDRFYNAGPGKVTDIIVGPAAECAGVAYLPPTAMTVKTVGGTSEFNLPFPTNITHPLPGVDGALSIISIKTTNLTRKIKGKTVSYYQSTSCPKGKRTFTFTAVDDEGTHVETTNLGTCKS